MPEYAWMCQYKHYYKYALGPKYAEILNMAKFWISQELHRVLNMLQYFWMCLNKAWIYLNMSAFTITDRVLNMYDAVHRVRTFYWLMNICWETKWHINMTGFWICVRMQSWKGSGYPRIPGMAGFCVCKRCTRFWLIGFWKYLVNVYRVLNKPPVLNMPGFRIWQNCEYAMGTQGAEYAWINLKMP